MTERLAENFADVLEEATVSAVAQKDSSAIHELQGFVRFANGLRPERIDEIQDIDLDSDETWTVIVAPQETALHDSREGPVEVVVLEYRYTPHGLMYELEPVQRRKKYDITSPLSRNVPLSERIAPVSGVKWIVSANTVQPIPGKTKVMRVNLVTGESEPI